MVVVAVLAVVAGGHGGDVAHAVNFDEVSERKRIMMVVTGSGDGSDYDGDKGDGGDAYVGVDDYGFDADAVAGDDRTSL